MCFHLEFSDGKIVYLNYGLTFLCPFLDLPFSPSLQILYENSIAFTKKRNVSLTRSLFTQKLEIFSLRFNQIALFPQNNIQPNNFNDFLNGS